MLLEDFLVYKPYLQAYLGDVVKMPGETTRTITKHGRFSGVVALPTDFRRYHKLIPGSEVRVLYDGLLLIIPRDCEKKFAAREAEIKRLLE